MTHWPLLTYLNYTKEMIILKGVSNYIVVILSRNYVLLTKMYCLLWLNDSCPMDWPGTQRALKEFIIAIL